MRARALLAIVGLLVGATIATGVAPASVAAADPVTFVPLTPARLLDTRGGPTIDGRFSGQGALPDGPGAIAVAGRGGVPATGAAAVVLNVTIDNSSLTGQGFVTVYPTGSTRPNASSLNVTAGAVVANEIVAKLGPDGTVTVFTQVPTHVVVDVVGWFPSATSSVFPLVPARFLDTRADGATVDGAFRATGPLGAGLPFDLQVAGRGGVPSGVAAVVMNVTVVNEGLPGAGFVTIHPRGTTRPNASSINFVPGQVVANEVVARVGTNDSVTLFASAGTHLVVDVVGYFFATGAAGYNGLIPARLMDTRPGNPITVGRTYDLMVLGRGNVPISGVAAVVLNITVDHSRASTAGFTANSGFVTVFAKGVGRPTASTLNFSPGAVVANETLVAVGTGGNVSIFVSSTAHVIVDVVGWVGGNGPTAATTPSSTQSPPWTAVQAVYVVPADRTAVAGRTAAITNEVSVVQNWYDGQTGGRHPVFVKQAGAISVLTVNVPQTSAQLDADADAHETLENAVLAALPGLPSTTALALFYEGKAALNRYCGVEIGRTIVMVFENCGGITPSAASTWPFGMSYLLGHELTHLLGATPSCAPHYTAGHVNDDRRDVIYQGPLARDWNNLMLDPGRDDYYLHGRTDCFDIDDSLLLGTA